MRLGTTAAGTSAEGGGGGGGEDELRGGEARGAMPVDPELGSPREERRVFLAFVWARGGEVPEEACGGGGGGDEPTCGEMTVVWSTCR